MVNWQIEIADVVDWATDYTGPKFHALLGDAPYELKFMGKKWDATGVSFQPETWEALGEHLYPGAIGMVFASAKGWHRLACAIEDAGMIIQPSIFGWVTGQGFPKSTRMRFDNPDIEEIWQGHKYGAHTLKPSLEPIIVFQKPWEGKRLSCIAETGAGAMWVDGSRVGIGQQWWECGNVPDDEITAMMKDTKGRWPSNFFLQHYFGCRQVGVKQVRGSHPGVYRRTQSDAVNNTKAKGWGHNSRQAGYRVNKGDANGYEIIDNWECVPGCPVRQLGETSNVHPAGNKRVTACTVNMEKQIYEGGWRTQVKNPNYYGDNGTVSRFFFQAHWSHEIIETLSNTNPVMYCSKAYKAERNSGLDGFYWQRDKESSIGFSRVTKGEWDNLPEKQRRQGNVHTTIKPIALGIWLSRLLSPPIEYAPRRLLVPFAGVGSEVIAAILSKGWEEITGIELLPENAEMAIARCQWWEGWKQQTGLDDPKAILKESKGKEPKLQFEQLELTGKSH